MNSHEPVNRANYELNLEKSKWWYENLSQIMSGLLFSDFVYYLMKYFHYVEIFY